jgi:hypothetical protein
LRIHTGPLPGEESDRIDTKNPERTPNKSLLEILLSEFWDSPLFMSFFEGRIECRGRITRCL